MTKPLMTKPNILRQVNAIAREAAKSGHGWHVTKNGSIVCANNHCTLGAVMFKRAEPARLLQARFDQLLKDAAKLVQKVPSLHMAVAVPHGTLFTEEMDDAKSFEGFPSPNEAAQALGLHPELTSVVTRANDNTVEELQMDVEAEGELKGTRTYGHAVLSLKARKVLERVLLKPKAKRAK